MRIADRYWICIYGKYARVRNHGKWIFEYFVPDQKKEGGSYQKKSGCIRRIDTYLNEIVLQSGERIPLDEIVDIDGVIAAADEV